MHKIFYTTALLFFSLAAIAQDITTIGGWTVLENTSGSVAVQSSSEGKNTAVYTIQKQVTGSGAVEEWFTASIREDLQKQQWAEAKKGSSSAAGNIYVYVTEVTDADKQKKFLLYMGYGFGKSQMRLARVSSTHDADFFQLAGKQASTHFGQLASKEMKGNVTVAETKKAAPAAPKTAEKNSITEISAAGKGVKSADIHSVIMHLEYEGGIGGGIYPVYNAYVLFKNGDIYKYPVAGIADLLVTASKQKEPLHWGQWKMSGSTLTAYWAAEEPKYKNTSWEKSSYYTVNGAKKGEQLEGSFKTLTGGGNTALGGDVMVVSAANISFNKEGKFTLARVAGVSSGRDIWENTHSKSNEAGTYFLDEYTIELKYNNGKTERRFFFFYPDSKKHFGIGHSVYMPANK